MDLPFPATAALLALVGCSWGFGPPVDNARIESAVLHEDGRRCVFALHDHIYRPATGMRAFPDGGIPKTVLDVHAIGIVDVSNGVAETVVQLPNTDFLPGQGGFTVVEVWGDRVLLGQGGQVSYEEHAHRWWELDLATRALTRIPVHEEMVAHDLTVKRLMLADAGRWIAVTERPDRPDAPATLWARDPDGTLRRLVDTAHFYGIHDNELWWYDPATKAGCRTRIDTGITVREHRADFAIPRIEPTASCTARRDRRGILHRTRVDGGWVDSDHPVDPSAFR